MNTSRNATSCSKEKKGWTKKRNSNRSILEKANCDFVLVKIKPPKQKLENSCSLGAVSKVVPFCEKN
jgi:hypothetical protein